MAKLTIPTGKELQTATIQSQGAHRTKKTPLLPHSPRRIGVSSLLDRVVVLAGEKDSNAEPNRSKSETLLILGIYSTILSCNRQILCHLPPGSRAISPSLRWACRITSPCRLNSRANSNSQP